MILFGLAGLALANDPDGYCAAVPVRLARRRAASSGGVAGGVGGGVAGEVGGAGGKVDGAGGEVAGGGAGPGAGPAELSAAAPRPEAGPRPDFLREPRPRTPGPRTPAGPGGDGQGGDGPGGGGQGPVGTALELRGVTAGYDGGLVLHGVDLAVRRGEILVVLGPNGAGKSTACRVAAGSLEASGGSVLVHGRDLTRSGPVRRARSGVLLAPEGRGIFPALTVEENLALHQREAEDRAAVYRRFPRLAERSGVAAGALSGGEQQMLALAPLLQRPPGVLIADEPSMGLAPRVVEEVYALLTELRDAGTALLLVEEKAAGILGVADTVAYLSRGRVTWCGPRAEVEADRLTAAYLGRAT
ncbi:ABC transporter ATP-binding protein [Streptomyces vinaceus]